jgi:hypothetical protein
MEDDRTHYVPSRDGQRFPVRFPVKRKRAPIPITAVLGGGGGIEEVTSRTHANIAQSWLLPAAAFPPTMGPAPALKDRLQRNIGRVRVV